MTRLLIEGIHAVLYYRLANSHRLFSMSAEKHQSFIIFLSPAEPAIIIIPCYIQETHCNMNSELVHFEICTLCWTLQMACLHCVDQILYACIQYKVCVNSIWWVDVEQKLYCLLYGYVHVYLRYDLRKQTKVYNTYIIQRLEGMLVFTSSYTKFIKKHTHT